MKSKDEIQLFNRKAYTFMEEKTEKITKYNDNLFTINKEIDEDMTEVSVRQKKPYVAPKCEVIKLEGENWQAMERFR